MKHSNKLIVAAMSAALTCATAGPQTGTSDRQYGIAKNSAKLTVTLKLDRDVYFPGEDAQITVRVANPGPEILEVRAPFDVRTGGLNLLERNHRGLHGLPPSEWIFISSHPVGMHSHDIEIVGEKVPDPPTIWLAANQPMERTFWISDACGQKIAFVGVCRLPEDEGEYRVTYWNAAAQFHIVGPKLEQWAEVVFQKPLEIPDKDGNRKPTGKTLVYDRFVRAVVLGYQSNHILAVSVVVHTGDRRIRFDPNGVFTGSVSRYFGVIRRLVTSSKAITAVQATADAAENITIAYTEDGQRFTLKLDPNRNPIPNP